MCEMYSMLTIKALERRPFFIPPERDVRSGVFIVNFNHI